MSPRAGCSASVGRRVRVVQAGARSAHLALLAGVVSLVALLLGACGATSPAASSGRASKRANVLASTSPHAAPGCPAHARLTAASPVSIGRGDGPVAVEGNTVWVARTQAGTVTRVGSASTRSVLRVGGAPISLAIGLGRLWVAERDANRIVSINPAALGQSAISRVSVPVSVVAGPLGVWTLSLDAGALYALGLGNEALSTPIEVPVVDPSEMVMVGEDLWVLGAGDGGLSPVNIKLDRIVRAGFDQPGEPLSGLSATGTTIWLGEPLKRSLLRVDARSVSVQELRAPDDIEPAATAAGVCGIWVADRVGDLTLVDPRTAAPLTPLLHLGRSIAALAPSGTGVWVTDPIDGTLVRVDVTSTG